MLIKSLKVLSKQAHPMEISLEVKDRLPYYITSPCTLTCEVAVKQEHRYYVLHLQCSGQLEINCQRCLQNFNYSYTHINELAICQNDEMAAQMMATMDSMVQTDDELNLLEIVTDDLHLFSPDKHENC